MYIKLIFKFKINKKQMYSPRMYKYRDSYVRDIPTVHTFGSVLLTHTFPPPENKVRKILLISL